MEKEPLSNNPRPLVQFAYHFISGIRFIKEQLKSADLNPHEGRLRGSDIPERYIEIPDFPPESSESI